MEASASASILRNRLKILSDDCGMCKRAELEVLLQPLWYHRLLSPRSKRFKGKIEEWQHDVGLVHNADESAW